MASANPEREKKRDFVSVMLEKAQSQDTEPKPNVNNEDPQQIEKLTDNIKKRVQRSY